MTTHFERLFHSMRWADRQALSALRGCPAAQSEALPLFGHWLPPSTCGWLGWSGAHLECRSGPL
jgi:hypothetical protein